MFAISSEEERRIWLTDLSETAINLCEVNGNEMLPFIPNIISSNELYDKTFICMKSCLSGYLLRKFKNSSGWQKLWVVFTHFCLFFYKSYQVTIQSVDSHLFNIGFNYRMTFLWPVFR